MSKLRLPESIVLPGAARLDPVDLGASRRRDLPGRRGHGGCARPRLRRVVCVSATAGENGTPDPEAWPPARLGAVRRWESAAAMAVLGVEEHRIADFPDGELTSHGEQGVAWVGDLIDEIEPDTILTFASDGITFHPDHIAVHEWVTTRLGGPGLPITVAVRRSDRYGRSKSSDPSTRSGACT